MTSVSPAAQSDPVRRTARAAIAVAAASVVLLLAFQLTLMQHGRDQGIYSVVADVMLEGGAPYRDAWDLKTPGIFFVYFIAHAVFGPSMHAPRILEALALLSMVGAFGLISRRVFGGWLAGLLAGALAFFYHLNLGFWHTAQPESFGGPLIAWAVLLGLYRGEPGSGFALTKQLTAWVGCGALFALAGILKPPIAGGIVFVLILVLVGESRGSPGQQRSERIWLAASSVVAGGACVLSSTALYLALSGGLAGFEAIFLEFLPNYTAIRFSWSEFPALVVRVLARWPVEAHVFTWLGLVLLVVPRWMSRREVEIVLLVAGVVLAQIVGIALQAKFFAYHYGAVLPFVALLSVWGYAKLLRAPHGRWALVIVGLLAIHFVSGHETFFERSTLRFTAFVDPARRVEINDRLHTVYDVDAGANRRVAEWIDANTEPDASIHVWGFEPSIYHNSARRPASKYIYNVAQRSNWGSAVAVGELMEELAEDPPSVIVTVKGDPMLHVTGNRLDSEAALQNLPKIGRYLEAGYRKAFGDGDLTVYERFEGPANAVAQHVLVITVDTLRADYLSSAGYPFATTPTIDELSRSATVFERAVTPIPRTTPALASMLTGRYPHRTGVRSLLDRLSNDATSLAEIASSNGFETIAVISNHILTEERGLGRGFDVYDTAGDHRSAAATTAAALEAMRDLTPADSVFAWVHYIDPHVPYLPQQETIDSLLPAYEGRYARAFGQEIGGTGNAAYPKDLPKRRAVFENPLTESVNARVAQLYAADIRDTDDAIDELLSALRAKFGDDWTIVFTSDHGESLGERDYYYYDHGDYVYDATTRVPLVMQLPRDHPLHGARRVDEWVSLVDLAPTLVDLLGWKVAEPVASSFEGRSLVPSMRGESMGGRSVFAECGKSYFPRMIRGRVRFDVEGRFRAVWKGDWKLIWTPFAPDDRAFQLFNVKEDPNEQNDLAGLHTEKVAQLRGELTAWLAGQATSPTGTTPSVEDVELLRSLGYVE